MARKAPPIEITPDEQEYLDRWARRRSTQQGLALRARIVLACAEGATNTSIAARLGISIATAAKWRRRFLADRLEGLADSPRPGAPRRIDDGRVEEVIHRTLDTKPQSASHWSTRSMAKACGMSQSAVSRIWRAFGLKPHRDETFKLSNDPFFVEKVRDVVGLYMSPPGNAIVVCVDEKPSTQAIERTQPGTPALPGGTPARHTHDYVRHGTTSLFAALVVATGVVVGRCHSRQRQQEFLEFLDAVDASLDRAEGEEVHLVMDNSATHKTPAVKRWLLRHPEYHFHYTPTSSSWLNQVERFFAGLTERRLRRGSFGSVEELERAIEEYIEANNRDPKPFVWAKDADRILGSIGLYCQRTYDSGH